MARKGAYSNAKKLAKELGNVREEVEQAIFDGVDEGIGKGLETMRKKVRAVINDRRRGFNADQKQKLAQELNMVPKSRADLARMVFGEDLELAKFRNARDGITYQRSDSSNIIPVSKSGHIGISTDITDSTSYEEFLTRMHDRLANGIYVDSQGRMFTLPEGAEQELRDGIKIECSKEHIDHPDSKKAFHRWKTSMRKGYNRKDGSTERYLNTRVFQENVKRIMAKAVPLDPVLDMVEEGKFAEAQRFLNRQGSKFAPIIDRIQEVKTGSNLAEDEEAFVNTINLIRNMKIRKKKRKNTVTYDIVSSFNEDGEGFDNFLSLVNRQLAMWLVDAREDSFKSLDKAIKQALKA